jgi:hypothetical protein
MDPRANPLADGRSQDSPSAPVDERVSDLTPSALYARTTGEVVAAHSPRVRTYTIPQARGAKG